MFYLVAFQQKASGSRALIVGLVPVGKEEVMGVTTPDASKDANVSSPDTRSEGSIKKPEMY